MGITGIRLHTIGSEGPKKGGPEEVKVPRK